MSKETNSELQKNYGSAIKIFNTKIPLAVKVAESTVEGKSIFSYAENSKVADAYSSFAKEVDDSGKERKQNALTYDR